MNGRRGRLSKTPRLDALFRVRKALALTGRRRRAGREASGASAAKTLALIMCGRCRVEALNAKTPLNRR